MMFSFPEITWSETPFRHTVLTDAWDRDFLEECAGEFPAPGDPRWVTYDDPEEFGKKAGGPDMWGPSTKVFFDFTRNESMRSWLETQTGISSLSADTLGGGMHETGEGGRLDMHIDFNTHPDKPHLERRINMLVFLNQGWDPQWGGVLHLGPNREVSVSPEFGKTVIFECSDLSFHGHPEPVIGDHLRRSLACYFYAPSRVLPGQAHSTVWGNS